MTRSEFLAKMRFPPEWESLEMYPDDLFSWQISSYVPGHEQSPEHDRNGAFHWWLRKAPSSRELAKLLRLVALDPDIALASDVRGHIRQSKSFDSDLANLERQLFGDA
jgi:hypothetical protein